MKRFALAGLLAACGPGDREESSTADASVDGRTATIDAAPMVCYEGTTDVDVALQVQIEESCAIWNSLAELNGTARVTRAGTMLSIDFGNGVVFAGTVMANGSVNLSYVHQHPFSDGCGWQASETMIGQLVQMGCKLMLDYNYVESVVQSDGSCASPCSAMADVQLELTPIIL